MSVPWTWDGFPGWSWDGFPSWTWDGSVGSPIPAGIAGSSCGVLSIYDETEGTLLVTWPPFPGFAPSSYNIYVNGVLNQNVLAPARQATISGLISTSYSSGAVAPTPPNGPRPQNMPPNGVVTPSQNYDIKVVALIGSVEVAASMDLTVTPSPTSIMLTTPMKRLWPFPNTGLD
jgi:hypothetical protein